MEKHQEIAGHIEAKRAELARLVAIVEAADAKPNRPATYKKQSLQA